MVIRSRQECVEVIDAHGKTAEFIRANLRTPEEYFDEYKDKEPHVWLNVLHDLCIDGYTIEEQKDA